MQMENVAHEALGVRLAWFRQRPRVVALEKRCRTDFKLETSALP